MEKPSAVQAFLRAYADWRVLVVLVLGVASGLPLALSGATLSVWLSEAGVSRTAIGFFALVGLSYTWKFLWAPLMDVVPPPLLSRLGRRRGWAIWALVGLVGSTLALGLSDPAQSLMVTALAAVAIAFFSATLDIVIDAYRIEILHEDQQGAGSAAIIYGYRIGMLISGAGALYLAEFFDWTTAYGAIAALLALIGVFFLRIPEPVASAPVRQGRSAEGWFQAAIIGPFRSFAVSQPLWPAILLFAVLYKLGDALAGVMTNPLYVGLGFSKTDIANVSKVWGLVATLAGVFLGGVLVARFGILKGLLIGGVLQMASNLMFIVQAQAGADLTILSVTVFVENAAGGVGTAPFVAYLSRISQREYSATHYALLSALSAQARTLLASSGGWFADQLGWVPYFSLTAVAAIPGLIVLVWLMHRTEAQGAAVPAAEAGPSGR